MRRSTWLAVLSFVLLLLGATAGRAGTAAPNSDTTCPDGSITAQPPNMDSDDWDNYVSDAAIGYLRYEKFEGASAPICGIRWWGLNKYDTGSGFAACQENPMGFHIVFYQDNQGKPGSQVSFYTATVTGVVAEVLGSDTLFAYQANLDPCCTLTAGWVSVEGFGGSSCWFMWSSSSAGDGSACLKNPTNGLICSTGQHFRDLSLCLTSAPVQLGDASWGAVKSSYR